MTSKRVADYLGHMLEAASQACSYVEGMQKVEFLDDKRTQQAVVLNLLVIGESAAKLVEYEAESVGRASARQIEEHQSA